MRGFSKVDGRKEGKDESLQECHEQFDAVHENHESGGEDSHAITGSGRGFSKDEHKAHKRQDDDVARSDVRGQTNHQHDGLQEHSNDFDWNDDRHHKHRHAWRPEQVAPIVLVPIERCQQEDERCHHRGDANRTCDVESAYKGNQAQQVCKENEEKDRQQERQKLLRLLLSQTWHGDVVAHEDDERLQHVGQSRGGLARVLAVARRRSAKQEEQQRHDEQHPKHRLRDAEIVERRCVAVVMAVSLLV